MSERPRFILDGELIVALPREKAFGLFTARGERLAQTDDARTRVHVTYDITSLDESADTRLEEFAAGYDAMMREWERLIADALPRIAAPGAD